MKKGISYLVAIVMFAGCKEGWTSENKDQYLQACHDSPNASGMSDAQRKSYCQCSLDEVTKHYSNVEEVLINKDSSAVNSALGRCREQTFH